MPEATTPATSANADFMVQAMKNYQASKKAWEKLREAYNKDNRFVNLIGGQWDAKTKDAREAGGDPALEFNELHTPIQQIANGARKNRPQPKVGPGDDDSSEEGAEFLESRLRHIQYASQGDVAYDTAVECSATGGFGFLAITTEYVDSARPKGAKPSSIQEPRIKRILDPLTEYPDHRCIEPDFSDAKYWFSRQWVDRDSFSSQFPGKEPSPFEADHDPDWATEDQVCIAQYWLVDETVRTYVWLNDGSEGFLDEFPKGVDPEQIVNEREVTEREVTCYLIDASQVLKTIPHLGNWIPRVAVLAREVVVEGERLLQSAIRFSHDAQKLKNAYKSGIAGLVMIQSRAPWTGPKGTFKGSQWADANKKNYAYLEWDIVITPGGQIAPAPERNTFEAPIQALSSAAMAESDDIKRSIGYVSPDSMRKDTSGAAVMRREEQQDLTNYHFEDNLVRAQWHCARVLLDLDRKLADTPRMMRGRKADGKTFTTPVSVGGQMVPGQDPAQHVAIDIGQYDITITSGQTYESKAGEENAYLREITAQNPQLLIAYGDIIFEKLGYDDLKERAEMLLPPQIQQAMQAKQQGIPPQIQAQMAAKDAQIAQMKRVMQEVEQILKTKQIETQGKLDVEKLKLVRELIVNQQQHSHEAAVALTGHDMGASAHLLDHFHSTELAPDPNAVPAPGGASNK